MLYNSYVQIKSLTKRDSITLATKNKTHNNPQFSCKFQYKLNNACPNITFTAVAWFKDTVLSMVFVLQNSISETANRGETTGHLCAESFW